MDICLNLTVGSTRYLEDSLHNNSGAVVLVSHVATTVSLDTFPQHSSSPVALFAFLRSTLSAAVMSGEFVGVLNSVSSIKYSLAASTVTTHGNITSINLAIVQPTSSPSPADGVGSSSSASSYSKPRSQGPNAAVTAAAVSVACVVLVGLAVFWVTLQRKRKTLKDAESAKADKSSTVVNESAQNSETNNNATNVGIAQGKFSFKEDKRLGHTASDFRYYLEKNEDNFVRDSSMISPPSSSNSRDSVLVEFDQIKLAMDINE